MPVSRMCRKTGACRLCAREAHLAQLLLAEAVQALRLDHAVVVLDLLQVPAQPRHLVMTGKHEILVLEPSCFSSRLPLQPGNRGKVKTEIYEVPAPCM